MDTDADIDALVRQVLRDVHGGVVVILIALLHARPFQTLTVQTMGGDWRTYGSLN